MNKILNKMFGEDTSWTHWQWYKKFFNVTVFKYLVTWFAIVPLFAKILSKLPKEISFKPIDVVYTITLELPFYWELLWISSLLFVIAYLLYLMYCPQFIKTYSSYKDYKLHYHSPRWLSWAAKDIVSDKKEIDKFFKRMYKKEYLKPCDFIEKEKLPRVDIEEKQSTLLFTYDQKKYIFSMPRLKDGKENKNLTEIAEREVFWEVFGRFSSSKRHIRLIIIGLLYLSGIFFGIVLIQNIWSALIYFIK